ncbi:GANC, partial [Symbiodinium microadriaticum]
VFLRWAQYGAFLPLMENGGGGEHRPWMYDEQTTDIYRKFVTEHYRLIPYFMTTGMEAYESDGSVTVVRPVARRDPETPDYRLPEPSTLSYLLGPDLIVHPVATQAASKDDLYRTGSEVRMTFPSEGALGEESRWFSWFAPSDKSQAVSIPGGVEGGEVSLIRYVPLDSMAVYVRQNALIPLHASATDETVLFTWFNPIADSEKSADVREPASAGPGLVGTISLSADGAMTGSISAHSSKAHGGFGWVVVGITEPESVTFKVQFSTEETDN